MVANRSTIREDLYLVYAGRNEDNDKPIIKAHLNPLVSWIWVGVFIIVFGTGVALTPNIPATALGQLRRQEVARPRAAIAEEQPDAVLTREKVVGD